MPLIYTRWHHDTAPQHGITRRHQKIDRDRDASNTTAAAAKDGSAKQQAPVNAILHSTIQITIYLQNKRCSEAPEMSSSTRRHVAVQRQMFNTALTINYNSNGFQRICFITRENWSLAKISLCCSHIRCFEECRFLFCWQLETINVSSSHSEAAGEFSEGKLWICTNK